MFIIKNYRSSFPLINMGIVNCKTWTWKTSELWDKKSYFFIPIVLQKVNSEFREEKSELLEINVKITFYY